MRHEDARIVQQAQGEKDIFEVKKRLRLELVWTEEEAQRVLCGKSISQSSYQKLQIAVCLLHR